MDRSKIYLAVVVSFYNFFAHSSQVSSSYPKSSFDSSSSVSVLSYITTVKKIFTSSDDDCIKSYAAQALVCASIKQKATYNIISDLDALRISHSEKWNMYMNSYQNTQSGNTLLIDAVVASDGAMIDFLHRSGVDCNKKNYEGKTVLHSAVDVHDTNPLKVRPLFPTIELISYFVLTSLEHLSAYRSMNSSIKDASGRTALDIALQENLDDSVILFLLENFYIHVSLPYEVYLKVRDIVIKHKNQSLLARLDSQNFASVVTTHQQVQTVGTYEGNRIRSLSENDKFDQKQTDKLMNYKPFAAVQSLYAPAKKQIYKPMGFDIKQQYEGQHKKLY